ncbi:solute carrier family 25 (mitochondrial folate transporter), member 32 [Angomonas deanei]|uniref:Mitochondrial carrier protein, putative n=1 Tax=Angomonas deanei TaxID=59799 RepID=A0A7G2CBL5_9TRYP|nr:solute carrier family 25 (mitochondrial folate transporter), member 32 [Angomonas deanei]CAD2216327.1 Mitochondrial carrier protein, putative [Angomonas deanei]|eukprot:EPY39962.1 solute carrier family 25 (mitochondrial folate transporter), member 32 [Angomonas deanei]
MSNKCDPPEAEKESKSLSVIGKHSPAVIHTVSSQLASGLSTFAFYPFDFLRTRYMSQDGTVVRQHNGKTYNSILSSLHLVYKQEGLRTMYRGCVTAVVGATVAWGVYMYVYRVVCNTLEATSYTSRSLVSMGASVLSCLISSPIFLIKSRMQLEETTTGCKYRSFYSGFQEVVRSSGYRGLWKGVTLQFLLIIPNALGIPTYDFLKSKILRYRVAQGDTLADMTIMEVCLCSTLTKVLLLTLSHPLVLIRTRIQDQRALKGSIRYSSVGQSFLSILKHQGVLGMYRGFSMSLLYSLPRALFYYTCYEKTLTVLSARFT